MLYDKMTLPFDTGSFQKRWIDRGVDVARTELTAAGLLIGDCDQHTLLNGLTPAEFIACPTTVRQASTHYVTEISHLYSLRDF